MKKEPKRGLQLRTETVRDLSKEELRRAAGGGAYTRNDNGCSLSNTLDHESCSTYTDTRCSGGL